MEKTIFVSLMVMAATYASPALAADLNCKVQVIRYNAPGASESDPIDVNYQDEFALNYDEQVVTPIQGKSSGEKYTLILEALPMVDGTQLEASFGTGYQPTDGGHEMRNLVSGRTLHAADQREIFVQLQAEGAILDLRCTR
jgi:hypothetical protein